MSQAAFRRHEADISGAATNLRSWMMLMHASQTIVFRYILASLAGLLGLG